MITENRTNLLNRPPFLIGGSFLAVMAWLMGWIAVEYAAICIGAVIVGLVLHFRKAAKT